jgi:hypothetical protein
MPLNTSHLNHALPSNRDSIILANLGATYVVVVVIYRSDWSHALSTRVPLFYLFSIIIQDGEEEKKQNSLFMVFGGRYSVNINWSCKTKK